jgi:hypothetical protein
MRPVTLLPTNQVSDFSRNFLEMEHRAFVACSDSGAQ